MEGKAANALVKQEKVKSSPPNLEGGHYSQVALQQNERESRGQVMTQIAFCGDNAGSVVIQKRTTRVDVFRLRKEQGRNTRPL